MPDNRSVTLERGQRLPPAVDVVRRLFLGGPLLAQNVAEGEPLRGVQALFDPDPEMARRTRVRTLEETSGQQQFLRDQIAQFEGPDDPRAQRFGNQVIQFGVSAVKGGADPNEVDRIVASLMDEALKRTRELEAGRARSGIDTPEQSALRGIATDRGMGINRDPASFSTVDVAQREAAVSEKNQGLAAARNPSLIAQQQGIANQANANAAESRALSGPRADLFTAQAERQRAEAAVAGQSSNSLFRNRKMALDAIADMGNFNSPSFLLPPEQKMLQAQAFADFANSVTPAGEVRIGVQMSDAGIPVAVAIPPQAQPQPGSGQQQIPAAPAPAPQQITDQTSPFLGGLNQLAQEVQPGGDLPAQEFQQLETQPLPPAIQANPLSVIPQAEVLQSAQTGQPIMKSRIRQLLIEAGVQSPEQQESLISFIAQQLAGIRGTGFQVGGGAPGIEAALQNMRGQSVTQGRGFGPTPTLPR